MPTIEAGTRAPEIALPTADGGKFALSEARKRGPVIAAFFKSSCPVCQFTLPYLQRIFQAYPRGKATLVAVSQDDKKTTLAFSKEYGITFPVALDDTDRYPVSNAYGLTSVPSIFLIQPDGQITLSSVGWYRQDIEEVNKVMAEAAGKPLVPVFQPSENVPDFKAG